MKKNNKMWLLVIASLVLLPFLSNADVSLDSTNASTSNQPKDVEVAQDVQAEKDISSANSLNNQQAVQQEATNVEQAEQGMVSQN